VLLLVIFVATKSGTGFAKDGFCFVKEPSQNCKSTTEKNQAPKGSV
jgi:hypothetical protein